VPKEYEEDKKLGGWVDQQRALFRNGMMNQEREMRLEKIGFEFNGKEKWNLQFNKLRDYYVKHGHCEFFWTVDRFTFNFNSPTNIPPCLLPELQAVCQSKRKSRNCAFGPTISVRASKTAEWTRNKKRGSTKYLSTSLLERGRSWSSGEITLFFERAENNPQDTCAASDI
jgi:hypothetical protein